MKMLLCVAAFAMAAPSLAFTEGWRNVDPNRRERTPVKTVWTATFHADGSGFKAELRDGAEGKVTFGEGRLEIDKTNDKGYIVVTSDGFKARPGQNLRFWADWAGRGANPETAVAVLRAWSTNENFRMTKGLEGGGGPFRRGVINTAEGTTMRKYGFFRVDASGLVHPVLIIAGTPSKTTWITLGAEDLTPSAAAWAKEWAAKTNIDRSADEVDDATFDRELAADVEHTAKVQRIDGLSRLVVDGKVVAPMVYRSRVIPNVPKDVNVFAMKPVQDAGVRIAVTTTCFGRTDDSLVRAYWTKDGFDAKGAAEDIRQQMKIADKSVIILGINVNAYAEFTAEHPEETWRKADGSVVYGTSGSALTNYCASGKATGKEKRWPWISYSSRVWREAVKANLTALVTELKRTGLAKRVVGVHFTGYHDGQFASPFPDYSKPAKREYAEYLKEDNPGSDYNYFAKQTGFRAQEDFVRHMKKLFGKPIIGIRWCMLPFGGANEAARDITAFARSDAMDVIVPQPTYPQRPPGVGQGRRLPTNSLHLHGKMMWYEFDLRTYGGWDTWAKTGFVGPKVSGMAEDFGMWQTTYRKHAGIMFAANMGYWFYDMANGWFYPQEIAQDIGLTQRQYEGLLAHKPSTWRPGVAIVIDEEGQLLVNQPGCPEEPGANALVLQQWPQLAASGVPYDVWLADDWLRNPSLATKYRVIVFATFRKIDERRKKLLESLKCGGRTLVFLSATGLYGGAEVTGFAPSLSKKKMSHEIRAVCAEGEDAASIMHANYLRAFYRWQDGSKYADARRVTVSETYGMRVLARYVEDGAPAVASLDEKGWRGVYVCDPGGVSPGLFNRLAREGGAYVPVEKSGLQVDMNGNFISVHGLLAGRYDFRLPFPCKVTNMKSGQKQPLTGDVMRLDMDAGETCWFQLSEGR